MPKLLHKEGECQRSGECVSGSVSGSGVGVGVGVGVRVWVWEWEWACGRRGSSTGRAFARRPQGRNGSGMRGARAGATNKGFARRPQVVGGDSCTWRKAYTEKPKDM